MSNKFHTKKRLLQKIISSLLTYIPHLPKEKPCSKQWLTNCLNGVMLHESHIP